VTSAAGLSVKPISLTDGTRVALRPIRSDDESALTALYERLSPQTAYQRFFTVMRRLTPNWAHILANVDYDRRMAFVALGPGHELIGVARYAYDERVREAEIAVVIEDRWQGRGLGTLLLGELIDYAQGKGIATFRAYVLAENVRMLKLPPERGHDPRSNAGIRGAVPALGPTRTPRAGHRFRGRLSPPTGTLTPGNAAGCASARAAGRRRLEPSHAGTAGPSRTGKLRMNVAPSPGADWTSIVPR
jgi:RimJ/RimL family protein N-acetyltransferase